MLPDRTTTTGDSLPVMHINAFHIIRADVTIMPETRKSNQSHNKNKQENHNQEQEYISTKLEPTTKMPTLNPKPSIQFQAQLKKSG